MAVILGGLSGLSMLAVLDAGPAVIQTTGHSVNSETAHVSPHSTPAPISGRVLPEAPNAQNSEQQVSAAVANALWRKSMIAEQNNRQVQQLRGENNRLKETMAAMENETLNLNSELLQLELSLAQLNAHSRPRQIVETRTVYNFVNVPHGSSIQSINNSPGSLPPIPTSGGLINHGQVSAPVINSQTSNPVQLSTTPPRSYVDNYVPQGFPVGTGSIPLPQYNN